MLTEKIDSDLRLAMKGKDTAKISVVRLLKTAINNKLIEKNLKVLDDGDIIALIRKDIDRHRDSIEQFKKGGRNDLAQKEALELDILRHYLPPEPSLDEIRNTVKQVITEANAAGKKDFGKVMKLSVER